MFHHLSYPTLALAILVAALSIARTARLLTYDDFPPAMWLRTQALARLPEPWQPLATCPFCLAPYLSIGMALWVWLSQLNAAWWWINGTWAAAYVAAIIVARDEQPE